MQPLINYYEQNYKSLLKSILSNGVEQHVRDGADSLALFGLSIEFEDKFGKFPMLTSKEMFFKNIKYELFWILSGETNVEYLRKNGVTIWDLWAKEDGSIGNTYGKVLRNFNGIDQLRIAIEKIENDLQSRRNVISLWNPEYVNNGEIAPCYPMFQFVVIGRKLNIMIHQRSADMFIGLPYDVAVFYLLLRLIADKYDLIPGVLKINIGNAHIYKEHIEPVNKYISNKVYDLPRLYNRQKKVINFNPLELELNSYIHMPFIKAKIIK